MNVTQPFHVGIISHSGIEVQRSQEDELISILGEILGKFRKQVVLHHCGSSQADNIGRDFAVNEGWQVQAHPDSKAAGMIPRRTTGLQIRPEVIRPAQIRTDRDKEVIRMSHRIVVVESGRGTLRGLALRAEAEGRAVNNIKRVPRIAPPMTTTRVQMDWLVDEPN